MLKKCTILSRFAILCILVVCCYEYYNFNGLKLHIYRSISFDLSLSSNKCCIISSELTQLTLSENDKEFQFDYNNSYIKRNDRPSTLPLISSSFFRSLANAIIDLDHRQLSNYVTKPNDIIYVERELYHSFIRYLPSINASFILISHWSDLNISRQSHPIIIKNPHLIVWFSTNVIDEHEKLRIIPQGILPVEQDKLRMINDIMSNMTSFNEKTILLYTPFWATSDGRWSGRQQLSQQFCSKYPNRSDIVCSSKSLNWTDYMRTMANSKFVISPSGRGLDCYRTWEALLVGAVPIVLNSSINRLYDDMPIMIIDDYRQLTIEKLQDFEKTLSFRNGIISPRYKLWARYWLNEIGKYLPSVVRSDYNNHSNSTFIK